MDWAGDLKQTFKKTVKRSKMFSEPALAGIQSGCSMTPDYDFQENMLSDEFSSGMDLKPMPMKGKRVTGWTDEPVRSGSSGKNKNKPTASEMERFNAVVTTHSAADDIPELPDLDDLLDDSAITNVVETKVVAANRVETYKELNLELLKYSEFASSENIDLAILMQCVQDESVLVDPDEPLTKEQLFNEVASFIQSRPSIDTDNEEKVSKSAEAKVLA